MAADDLATQGARSSATMVLTWFPQNILVAAPEGFKYIYISMGLCNKDVTPLLTHWSYVFLDYPINFISA